MKKLLVVGSSNIDHIIKMKRMPAVGETVIGDSLTMLPGGKGANQAYACGVLGGDTTFLSIVGDDGLGEIIINNMNRANVDVSRLKIAPNTPTGMAIIYIDERGNNSIVVISGANSGCDEEYIRENEDAIQNADILLVQLETPLTGIYRAIKKAKSLGKLVVLNPAPAPDEIPDDIITCVDYLTPNETELQKLTGCSTDTLEEVEIACKMLLNRGLKHLLVTLGDKGAMLMTGELKLVVPPPEVKVVDTTAAGDTFNAAFVVELAKGSDTAEAIRFANAAASIAVSRFGAQTSIPMAQEVIDFLKAH